jgi:methylphosphotriester-DNA--protein-cysteine methyltransferase
MVGKGAEKALSKAVSDMDQDIRALRRAFKAIRALSPEALRLARAKIRRM